MPTVVFKESIVLLAVLKTATLSNPLTSIIEQLVHRVEVQAEDNDLWVAEVLVQP